MPIHKACAAILLHQTATHCNTLQHTATHCNSLQHTYRQAKCSTKSCAKMPIYKACAIIHRLQCHIHTHQNTHSQTPLTPFPLLPCTITFMLKMTMSICKSCANACRWWFRVVADAARMLTHCTTQRTATLQRTATHCNTHTGNECVT